jgi:glycosyltransferase involved in cell wall biosynthesis
MSGTDASAPDARLAALEEDNRRLRTALAAAEARAALSGHELVLADAMCLRDEPLAYTHPAVAGRVSVIVPAYNAAAFLERAVRSVWSQTFPADAIELLVVDDGSQDGTRALAERLARRSPVSMKVLTHEGGRNRGVAPTRQRAAREATGALIALLDADDVFLPERLEASVDTLTAHPHAAAVCSLGRNVDDDGLPVVGHNGGLRAGDWRGLPAALTPPFTFDQLWRADPIANSTLTIRREALERVGGFPTLMAHQAEDWLLVLKLSVLAPIPCLDRDLILYTHHPGAYTNGYHAHGWREGARLETFYHAAWWMLRQPEHTEAAERFFRREYPRQIADHHRLLPLLREYYAEGGRPAAGAQSLREHVQRLAAELGTLRRTVQAKLHENKRLRQLLSQGAHASPAPPVRRRTGQRRARLSRGAVVPDTARDDASDLPPST